MTTKKTDAAHLTVEVVDASGSVVPAAGHRVEFRVEGPAAVIGVDNGNPRDHDPFKASARRAHHGLCLAVIQGTGQAGRVRITARTEGLAPQTIELEAVPTPQARGVPAVNPH